MITLHKKMPYWLRGGIIAGGLTLISYFLYYSCSIATVNSGPESWACLPYLIFSPMFPFAVLFDTNQFIRSLPKEQVIFLLPIVSVISWFIIGALIGLIVKYIKLKK